MSLSTFSIFFPFFLTPLGSTSLRAAKAPPLGLSLVSILHLKQRTATAA